MFPNHDSDSRFRRHHGTNTTHDHVLEKRHLRWSEGPRLALGKESGVSSPPLIVLSGSEFGPLGPNSDFSQKWSEFGPKIRTISTDILIQAKAHELLHWIQSYSGLKMRTEGTEGTVNRVLRPESSPLRPPRTDVLFVPAHKFLHLR
jgi:hypothetical protein